MESAEVIDSVLESSLELVEGAVALATQAESETTALRTKVSEQEKVILEKVAKQKIQADLIQETIRQLVDRSYLAAHHAEKLASQLKEDPNQALYLVQRLTQFGPAHEEGQGTKSAGLPASTVDQDGWGTVVHKGAA